MLQQLFKKVINLKETRVIIQILHLVSPFFNFQSSASQKMFHVYCTIVMHTFP